MGTSRKIEIPYRYKEYAWLSPAAVAFLKRLWLWLIIHRRGGKDLFSYCRCLLPEAIKHPGTYLYLWPTLKQGRHNFWEGKDEKGNNIIEHYTPPELILKKDNVYMKLHIKANGGTSIIQVYGTNAGQYANIRGEAANGVVFSEYAYQDPRGEEVVSPMLMKTNGWRVYQSTPNGENHFKRQIDGALMNPLKHFVMTATIKDTYDHDGNPLVKEENLEVEREIGKPEDIIQQEYYCSFSQGIDGTYIGKQMQELEDLGRIENLPYDSAYLVNTYWDLGVRDFMAVWFVQQIGQEVRFIDYEEATGSTFTYWARLLQEKGYLYGAHYAPFDIKNREMIGKEEVAKSRLEHAKDVGILFRITPNASFENGVDTLRGLLGLCRFDYEKCKIGINHLKMWGKRYDNVNIRYTGIERDDQHTHAGAAARYAAINIRQAQGYDVLQTREQDSFEQIYRRTSDAGSFMSV